MDRSTLSTRIALTALLSLSACGTGMVEEEAGAQASRNALSWNEFLTKVYREPATGIWIVDGDTPLDSDKKLAEFYQDEVRGQKLIINQTNGVDTRWTDAQKLQLTYCISKTFGTRQAAVIQAMATATSAWMGAANVKFAYVAAQDAACTASNAQVLFDVNPVNVSGQYLARSFFPGQGRSTRNILIDNSTPDPNSGVQLAAVLRHELGHTLGFRHEHTRPEAGACFEDNSWRALTPYDSASVMHYPQCNGTGGWNLVLTSKDVQGAQSVYGAPGSSSGTTTPSTPTTPSSGNVLTQTAAGNLAAGAAKNIGPISVQPGTSFEVVMTGSGDPDLYVNFGSAPTATSYACRPYLDGANESCLLTVPASAVTAYVTVVGYSASTYSLTIKYTKGSGLPSTAPSGPTARSTSFAGSLAQGAQGNHGPLTVAPGTTFQVVMTGSGDPDLYVRFGAAPTLQAFDCRPYLQGADETCTITVPAGQTKAYLMVDAYAAASYNLQVSYFGP